MSLTSSLSSPHFNSGLFPSPLIGPLFPLFLPFGLPTDTLFDQQWYLRSIRVVVGEDAVWRDYTGAGVTVGIFDNGVDAGHADLDGNFSAALTFEQGTPGRDHGTAVAGVVAAERNGTGIVGVAYDATIGSVNIWGTDAAGTGQGRIDAAFEMRNFDVAQHSWGVGAFGAAQDHPDNQAVTNGIFDAVAYGRGGLGTVVVAAAGNNRLSNQGWGAAAGDANTTGPATGNRHAITVAGAGPDGRVTDYSTPGANLLVTAGAQPLFAGGANGILTTDVTGMPGYVNGDYAFTGGTSFAAPQVSGVVALMLEANPNLGYRDVEDILAATARHTGGTLGFGTTPSQMVGNEKSFWQINGAATWNGGGMHFSNDYGFGLVDAWAAVRLAETWTGTQTLWNEAARSQTLDPWLSWLPLASVADYSVASFAFTIDAGVDVEKVVLDLNLVHTFAADLEIWLVSPQGTRSRLLDNSGGSADIDGWSFVSNAFRGEPSFGTWTVEIHDQAGGDTGMVWDATLSVFGDAASDHDTYIFTDEFGTLAALTADYDRSVVDGGTGIDAVNAAAVSTASHINLNANAFSLIAGRFVFLNNMENVFGGDGNDGITGNDLANRLEGVRGNDIIAGGGGNDTVRGGTGNDSLAGDAGNDLVEAGAGSDSIEVAFTGHDTVDGGSGFDILSFGSWTTSVDIDLATGYEAFQAFRTFGSPWLGAFVTVGSVTFTGMEGLDGSTGGDILSGTDAGNQIRGGAGNDLIDGRGGHDSLDGGWGDDRFVISVNGNDTIDGNVGRDSLDFAGLMQAVAIDLNQSSLTFTAPGAAATGSIAYSGVEDVIGTAFADTVTGSALANVMAGGDGHDVINAGGENDTVSGGDGNDVMGGNAGDDLLQGEGGNDRFRGDAGADTVDGGAGTDLVSFSQASQIRVFLDGSGTNAAAAAGDVLIGIENITGAIGNDMIAGDAGNNALYGFTGHDSLWGRSGIDTLFGEAGNDQLSGGAGNDLLLGGAGNDRFLFDQTLAAGGLDRTTDFNPLEDQIVIDASAFGGGLTAGGPVRFVAGAAPSAAGQAGGVFLYNTATGFLSFDADGGGVGAAVAFLRLQNLPVGLSAADFTVVA